MSVVKVYSGALPINTVNDMYDLFSRLGLPIDNINGVIAITSKKGLIKKYEVRYSVKIYMIGSNTFVFGILLDEGLLEAFAKLYSKNNEWYFECISKEYSHLCSSILDSIRKGVKLYVSETLKKSSNIAQQPFKLSKAFESFLDGFAEITATSAVIKYPVVERRVAKLMEVRNALNIIEYLYSKYKSGRYIVLMLGGDWMFSIAVDLDRKEFTPSLVVWSSNLRLLGEDALETLKQLNVNEDVRLTIYSMQE